MSDVALPAFVLAAMFGGVIIALLGRISMHLYSIKVRMPITPPKADMTPIVRWPTPGQLAAMLGFSTVQDMVRWRDELSARLLLADDREESS
jgi:hypothetical protein